tara:strand:- start:1244 stop:1834 length:591 start_codon:yes stop_codon:yes gene_type:complete
MNPKVKEGDKIVLVYMKDEQGMTPGTKGIVTRVQEDPFEKGDLLISVDWENGRSLSIVSAEDLWLLDEGERLNEGGNHHWTDWEKVSDVLGMENKVLYDFFEKLRVSSVMNMLESTHFIYSGSDYLRRYIQFNQYEDYDEDKYEDLYNAADEAKHAMIRLSIGSLDRKGKEPSLKNMNSEVKLLARQALQAFIMMK